MKEKKLVKILLVEDNPGDSRLISELIFEVDSSYLIKNVVSLKNALQEATEEYDAVLIDLGLPDSSGIDTYRRIQERFHGLPIVILSGNLDESTAITAVREGAQDYLIKGQPDGESLVRCIRYAIERKRSELELSQLRIQQQQSAKLASLGEMAGGVAHEINTPLGAILLTSQSLKNLIRSFDPSKKNQMTEMIELIEATSEKIAKIVKSLKIYSRNSSEDPFLSVNVGQIIENSTSLCKEKFARAGIDLKVNSEQFDHLKIQCRETEITQVLMNLLNNARDAIENLNEKWIRIDCRDLGESIELKVQDSGNGIPEKSIDKLFHPFFTTKEIGKGTGLGLSISKGIIESHAGQLTIDRNSKHTTFLIQLPKIQKRAAEEALSRTG